MSDGFTNPTSPIRGTRTTNPVLGADPKRHPIANNACNWRWNINQLSIVGFVIALGLFCRDSYRQVFKWLQPFRRKGTPGRSTLCEARQRLGVAPLHRLAQQVIELQATPATQGAFYHGLRLMALDSFVVDVPDSPANARVFGRPGSSRSPAAFPQARVLALCEVGTHVFWRTLTKPCHRSEVTMAAYLLRFLQEGMLLLWDRGFLSYDLVQRVLQRRAQLLARINNNLPGGSDDSGSSRFSLPSGPAAIGAALAAGAVFAINTSIAQAAHSSRILRCCF